jgi:hypothetical protein
VTKPDRETLPIPCGRLVAMAAMPGNALQASTIRGIHEEVRRRRVAFAYSRNEGGSLDVTIIVPFANALAAAYGIPASSGVVVEKWRRLIGPVRRPCVASSALAAPGI